MASPGHDLTRGQHSLVALRDGSFVEGNTLCVMGEGSSVGSARCRNVATGESLQPARFQARFDEVRKRLETSDIIIGGDLIPRPQQK